MLKKTIKNGKYQTVIFLIGLPVLLYWSWASARVGECAVLRSVGWWLVLPYMSFPCAEFQGMVGRHSKERKNLYGWHLGKEFQERDRFTWALSEVSQPLVFCCSGTLWASACLYLMMFNCILREVSMQTLGTSQHLTQLISCPLLLKRKSCTCSLLCLLWCLSALFGHVLKLFQSLFCLN